MAKTYAKFEVPKETVDKSLEALRLAKQSGSVRKGVNEVTKSVERGLAALVLIAGDVEPEEVVMHLPTICEQKRIPYLFVPTKLDLGKAAGLNVPCAAASIEKAGEGQSQLREVANWAMGKIGVSAKPEAPKEAAKPAAPKKEAPKREPKPQAPKQQAPKPQAPKPEAVQSESK